MSLLPALLYAWVLFAFWRSKDAVPAVESLAPDEPADGWPPLTILVAACNEAAGIEAALRTLVAVDYPNLRIVAVDDRSTDDTGAIIDRIAAEHPLLRAVHVTDLPGGWLGKVHALARGWEHCDGGFVLMVDADVHLEADTMRRVVAWAQRERLDHVTAIPTTWRSDLWAEACWTINQVGLVAVGRLWAVRDPDSSAHLGCGAFNLVRHETFEATEGFDWFRLDVADDWAVGLLVKSTGGRCALVRGLGRIHLPWYAGIGEMIRGLEKNFYAILARYSVWRGAAHVLALLLLSLSPFLVALLPGVFPKVASALAIGLMLLSAALVGRWVGRPGTDALLLPLGGVLNAWMIARATWLGVRRGGVIWRGTLYRREEMLGGMRVRF